MPPSDPHPDPIVRDLRAIRRLKWSRPEQFGRLEVLLTHPLIGHFAFQPKEEPQRVMALKAVLQEVIERIQEKEGEYPPQGGRSVAEAATGLLRLTPEFEEWSLERIRTHIVDMWGKGRGGSNLTRDGFRLHLEVPQVYEPVADEFRLFAEAQAEDYLPKADVEEFEARAAEPAEEVGLEDILSTMSVEKALEIVELERYFEHRREIAEGRLRIRSEDEMLRVLLAVTRVAKREFLAVDYVEVSEWFASPRLRRYLMSQLDRVAPDLPLTRIRVVRKGEMVYGSRGREQLEELIGLHDKCGATLLLCHEESVKKLMEKAKLRFAPHVGLLMIDPETEPAAVTGKLSGDGAIGQARVYLGNHPDLREYGREFEILKGLAVAQSETVEGELGIVRRNPRG